MNNYISTAEPKAIADGVSVYCAHDAIVDVAKLVPNPKNPNQHPDEQIQLLGRIIRQTGWRQPITVSTRSGFIVKGHGRLAAALLEGVKEVPVDYQNYASEAEEYADLVADNRIAELAEIDNKMLADIFADIDTGEIPMELTGFTEKEVENLITGLSEALHDEKAELDEVPETPEPEQVITKPGDLWLLGDHRLLCGDSTNREDVDTLMDGAKADMVFTDPPYNCNYGNIKHKKFKVRSIENDNMTDEKFRDFCTDFILNIREFATGCVYMCAGQGHDGRTMFMVADNLLHNSTTIIWNKDMFTLGRGKYQNKYEPIWFGWVENGSDFTDDRTLTNVWDIDRPKKSELHPTMKPVEVMTTAMKHNPKSKTVLDLFGGSGSTLIASELEGRDCFMMELDPKYCDVIVRRYIKTTGKTDIRLIRHGEEQGREVFERIFSE